MGRGEKVVMSLVGALCVALAAGCGGGATGMRPVQTATYTAPTDQATVVFVRHSSLGKKINFPVVDENEQWVGNTRGKMHAIAFVAPGEHTFYVMAENTEPVHADLEAGLTYVIETRPRVGWGKARVTAEVVHKGTPSAAEAGSWIKSTAAMEPVAQQGDAWVQANAARIHDKRVATDEAWEAQDDAWRAAHTLKPDDGFTPAELGL